MKRIALALVCAGLAAAGQAQDAKVSKEREALRRAQSALRAAQEQQSALQADRDKATAEATAARKDAAGAKAAIATVTTRLRAREAEVESLTVQLQAARQALQDAQVHAAEREQASQQQLLALRQESAGRLQANQALAALLQRSTQALADAEAKNHQLHAIGQDLLQRWLDRTPLDTALLHDPVLGLTAIRFEDQAESLRSAMQAQRIGR